MMTRQAMIQELRGMGLKGVNLDRLSDDEVTAVLIHERTHSVYRGVFLGVYGEEEFKYQLGRVHEGIEPSVEEVYQTLLRMSQDNDK